MSRFKARQAELKASTSNPSPPPPSSSTLAPSPSISSLPPPTTEEEPQPNHPLSNFTERLPPQPSAKDASKIEEPTKEKVVEQQEEEEEEKPKKRVSRFKAERMKS